LNSRKPNHSQFKTQHSQFGEAACEAAPYLAVLLYIGLPILYVNLALQAKVFCFETGWRANIELPFCTQRQGYYLFDVTQTKRIQVQQSLLFILVKKRCQC